MGKKIVWLAVSCLMALSLVMAACAPAVVEEEEEVVEEEENGDEEPWWAKSDDPLGHKTWILQSYGEQNNLNAVLEGTEITVFFDDHFNQVMGEAGCNSYMGVYESDNSELTITSLANTEKACLDPEGVMDQEQQYLKLLRAAESYSIEGEELQINCGNQLLVYTAE